ncbi:MarR family transcriptional regulator [Vibrio sp.]|uniref:MarR family winged helix-turn-helix transcriptional regulator n=1 Tax=Vibrio sp. TaxID=678 RepID=UPI00311FA774
MDAIDRLVEQWAREKPELDTEPMAIMGRLLRVAKYMENEVAQLHKQYDLTLGEFDVLATLRRSGEPFQLTPSELIDSMMLTSGAMTNRLDKLTSKGLIIRQNNQSDRRSLPVQLTKQGVLLIDRVVEEHVVIQRQLVKGLSQEQKKQISLNLKCLMYELEGI